MWRSPLFDGRENPPESLPAIGEGSLKRTLYSTFGGEVTLGREAPRGLGLFGTTTLRLADFGID